MTVKQHVKRLNEFKKLLDKEDQDQNIEALRKNDEFMAEFDGLDKKWGGKLCNFYLATMVFLRVEKKT